MKKITQNLTKLFWRSSLFAMAFLFSLTINSQEVGQEYLVNPGINTATGQYSTTPETGVDGSGNFPANLGGWTNGIGGAYASASDANGACHSDDRMFKFFKVGGPDGQYVNQTITALPAGNYNWSFYTKWGDVGHASGPTGTTPGNLPSWSAEGDNQPKFTILVQDADGAWVADQATVMTEPSTVLTWVQDSGTWTNTETRDVRIKFAKNGGTAAGGGSNTDKLMYVDDASLTYASALSSSAVDSFPYCTSFDTDLGDWTTEIVSGTSDWTSAASNTTTGSSSVDAYSGGGSAYYYAYNYSGHGSTLMSTAMDISSVVNPQVTFQLANPAWGGDQETLQVWYKAAAGDAWTVLATYTDSSTSFSEVTVGLPNASSDYYIAFNATSGYGYGVLIDDVCVDAAPTEPAMSVTATTDGGSATFSFTIDNFTVGAAAGEGDGHIHWSIFAASDLNTPIYDNVMVYSTDDLTLSPLPNGDHVIVFSLVDANHQPLDPAVEATVEFSTFDGTAACGETVTYTQVANGDYTVAATAPEGQVASVTINATMENNYDYIYVTDGAGNSLNADQTTGSFTDAVYSSSDGTISVNVTNDGSVQNGDVTLAFSCEEVSTSGMITFNVDMNAYSGSQYEDFGAFVNGEFTGWCGACAPMTDDDGDGIWTTTIEIENGTYFWKYTVNGWNDQESFNGTEVVDGCTAQNGDNIDRILVVNGDQTLDTVFFNMCAGETPGSSLELQGIIDFTVPSGGSDGKAIHVVATENIPNLAYYGIGVANNGGGTDGQEFTFPSQSMAAGQHYLAARSVDVMNTYMDASSVYDVVSSEGEGINDISQNGDDAIELYMGGNAVELFGELDVDGSGQPWEYLDSWAYKVDGAWTYGEVDTTDGTETICEASTPYPFADCSGPGCGDSWEYTYVNNEDGATILYTFSNGGDSSVLSVTVTGQTETGYDYLIITDGAGNVLYNADGDHTGQVVSSGDGVINIAIDSDSSYAPGSDGNGNGTVMTFDATCAPGQNDELVALLESGSWRSDAETAGHIGVGPSGSTNAEWWNANAYDKADTGLYDDRWSFADGVLTVDTGDDGAIFGKKAEIDAAFPDNTPYDADNGDNEYLYYVQDDYSDTFTVSASGAPETVTFATNGNLGFFTSVAGQEFQVLTRTDITMYVRNVGSEGNAWYNRLTTAEALSTVDAMVLDMRIYPNPSNGSYVTIQTPVNGVKYVEVFDITGKRLINTSLSADTLDVSSMSSGMYLVKVTVEGQSKTSKLIIR